MRVGNHISVDDACCTGVSATGMDSLDFDFSKAGKKWVSYFDRLGFGSYSKQSGLVEIFSETCNWLRHSKESAQDLANVEFVWFSDTILFYSTDDSKTSFQAVAETSRCFFDELLDSRIPVRGALAFGDFYADKPNALFMGKALVDAFEYGEKFDWLGFVIHPSALARMEEVGQPVSELTYRRWDAEFKSGKTLEKESVVAYVAGPGSIMPIAGGNPYLDGLEEMASQAECESHKRKYVNTIQFLRNFN